MSTSSPFLLFFNTLSDRLASNGSAFFCFKVKLDVDMSEIVKQNRLNKCTCFGEANQQKSWIYFSISWNSRMNFLSI
jgi:hypothetical protein